MRIVFTVEAKRDLDNLRSYLKSRSVTGFGNITLTLERMIRIATDHPEIGRPTVREGVRELVDADYGFTVPYSVAADTLYILRVYSAKQKPLNYQDIKLP